MQAIILATSETGGLHPLTESIPTGMLPILGRPVMVGAIEQVAQQGIKQVVVSLHHLPGSVEAYFGTGQRWNLALEYVLQREQWGSAGALKWAENLLTETFLVLPADQVFELDIQALWEWHHARGSQVTAVIHPRGRGAGVTLDAQGRVSTLHSGAATPSLSGISTGIFLFEPAMLSFIPPRTVWDIATDLLPHLVQQGIPVYGYTVSEFWHPIQSFQDYQAAHWAYLEHLERENQENNRPVRPDILLRARPVARGIWVGRNTLIHPSARLSPPVFIGENSFVGRDVELGPGAMLGSNVLVDDGATIAHSSILDNTYVGQFVNVKNSIASAGLLIHAETGESIPIVDQFLLGETRSFNSGSVFQRLPDRMLAFLLLVGLFPFLLICALVALISTGKLFSRIGRSQSSTVRGDMERAALPQFHLVQFSTQLPNGKTTSGGKWLERWEFHRLPELWNVLIGDLRLIGVKSLSVDEESKMVEKWQQKRNEYPSGFTGLWYLQTQAEATLDEILIADAYYVATRTWQEDVRIFWQTFPTWWKRARRGA